MDKDTPSNLAVITDMAGRTRVSNITSETMQKLLRKYEEVGGRHILRKDLYNSKILHYTLSNI